MSGQPDFFGLDLGATAVRAVELKGSGPIKELVRYSYTPIEGTLGVSDAEADHEKLAALVKDMLSKASISGKNVAVNLPASRVFTAIVDMDKMAPEELAKTIRYQADSFIPTPLADSKVDWAILGDSPADPKKVEVLLSSAANNYIEPRLKMLESIGLNVVAFEPDTIALARALIAPDSSVPQLVLDLGGAASDLVIVVGQVPRLARSIPIGQQAMIQAVGQQLGIDTTQAHQFVFKFGMSQDKLERKVFNAIEPIVESLAAEIEKSIKFFMSRYPSQKIDHIIVTGGASVLPEFPLFLANRFGLNVEIGNSWRNVSVSAQKQSEAASVSNQFAVAAGLAERS